MKLNSIKRNPLYRTWNAMKQRCYNKNHEAYKNYGSRGIKVCIRWRLSFVCFLKDMGKRPDKNYTLDRIDNDDDYTPDNCKWSTRKEQANNRRRRKDNIWLTYKGKTLNLFNWSKKTGILYITLRRRYRKGLKPKEILSPINIWNRKGLKI